MSSNFFLLRKRFSLSDLSIRKLIKDSAIEKKFRPRYLRSLLTVLKSLTIPVINPCDSHVKVQLAEPVLSFGRQTRRSLRLRGK